MSHTKGPWQIHRSVSSLAGKLSWVLPIQDPKLDSPFMKSDALLIASAPELLEALNKIVQNIEDAQCHSLDDFKDLVAMAHDVSMKALAKASEGEGE